MKTHIPLYTGKRVYYNEFGEAMYCTIPNIDVFPDPFISKEEPNFIKRKPYATFSYFNPKTWADWFTNGVLRVINRFNGVKVYKRNASSQDPSISNYALDIPKTNFGQAADIEHINDIYLEWKKQKSIKKKLIFWGYSGGCGAITGALKKYQYEEVALVVLEGCFYSVEHNLDQFLYRPFSKIVNWGLSLFTDYCKNGIAPCHNLDRYPVGVPFVFITSDNDRIIHPKSSKALADALVDRGKNPVYYLKLKNANHLNYPTGTKKERKEIQNFMHAIYEKYNLKPYRPEFAIKGRNLLSKYRIDKLNDADHTYTAACI